MATPVVHDNVRSWATDLDEQTRLQADRSASLPIVAGPMATMPDNPFGYGATGAG